MKITVKAIGVNRADVFYRQGKYPVQGLELSGLGEDGKRYASIVDGGAYAKEVEVEEGSYIELPEHFSFEDGAAIIEALYTSYYNLVVLGKLKAGESVLIHGGASGVGVVAIQLAKLIGAKVFATSGKPEKLKLIESLGAVAIDYNKGFGENAYDVILDIVGASYWEANLKALKKGGRLAIISFIGGAKAELNLAPLLLKNISVFGSTIRSLSNNEKWQIRKHITPIFGKIKPVIAERYKLSQLDTALNYIENYGNSGKVIINSIDI